MKDCPCDGTNDERGGGNFDHQAFVANIDKTLGDYALIVHTPHADEIESFKNSVPRFLMNAEKCVRSKPLHPHLCIILLEFGCKPPPLC